VFAGGNAVAVRVFLLGLTRQTIRGTPIQKPWEVRGAGHVFSVLHDVAGDNRWQSAGVNLA